VDVTVGRVCVISKLLLIRNSSEELLSSLNSETDNFRFPSVYEHGFLYARVVQLSLALRRFVVRGFANSRCRPKTD
jgi:hypothetical protein